MALHRVKPKIIENKIYLTHSRDVNLSIREHRAMKNYRCADCRSVIPKGSQYMKTVCIDDGYFMSVRWHKSCHQNHCEYINDQRKREG